MGGGVNDYTTKVYEKYKFPTGTRCFKTLPVRAGWASAVSHVQKKIAGGHIVIDKPVLSLFTEADEVLKASDIDSGNDMIHKAKSDGKGRALESKYGISSSFSFPVLYDYDNCIFVFTHSNTFPTFCLCLGQETGGTRYWK